MQTVFVSGLSIVRIATITVAVGSVFAAPGHSYKPPISENEIVARYVDARLQQQRSACSRSVEVEIDSSVPRLKKHGELHALKYISQPGKITYRMLWFSGDNFVKTEVIARFLAGEVKAAQDGKSPSLTPENYKFRYKDTEWVDGRSVYIFHVTPRAKKTSLFRGELWLDAATYLPLREVGSLVKTPAGVKKAHFMHQYQIENGVSLPKRWENRAEIRFLGTVELNIDYLGFSKEEHAEPAVGSQP